MNIFHTDEDVDGNAIRLAKGLNVQIITTAEAGLIGADDKAHFEYAVEHSCIMVTANIQDYAPLVRKWIEAGYDHPGIVYITGKRHNNPYRIARTLLILANRTMTNQDVWI